MRFFPCLWILTALFCGSCSLFESSTAILWTDEREFALYAGYFNAAQDRFKVEPRYFEAPAQKLTETGANPDLVIGSWLKSASTRNLFVPLDRFLRQNWELKASFYPHLLALGSIEGRQYLLPVSFNIPALVFARDRSPELSNPFTIGLGEIQEKGREYNVESGGVYTRLGFSPAWDRGFLYLTAVLFNASFREAAPLAWDGEALERAIAYIRAWIDGANSGIQAEDDFSFKYLYEPPPGWSVRAGSALPTWTVSGFLPWPRSFGKAWTSAGSPAARGIPPPGPFPWTRGRYFTALPRPAGPKRPPRPLPCGFSRRRPSVSSWKRRKTNG